MTDNFLCALFPLLLHLKSLCSRSLLFSILDLRTRPRAKAAVIALLMSLVCPSCKALQPSFTALYAHKGKCGVVLTPAEQRARAARADLGRMEALARRERLGNAPLPPPLEDDDPLRPRILRQVPREIENIILTYVDGRALRIAQTVSRDWRQRCSVATVDRERLLLGPWTAPKGIVTLKSDHTFVGDWGAQIDGKWFTCSALDAETEHEVETLTLKGRGVWPQHRHIEEEAFIFSVPLYKMNGGFLRGSWTRGALPGFVRHEMDSYLKAPPTSK